MLTIKNQAVAIRLCFLTICSALLFIGCTPAGPRALLDGEKAIAAGQYKRAVSKLQRAARLIPENPQVWNHLGLALHLYGDDTEALDAYDKALTLNPELAPARYNLGCLQLERGDNEAAAIQLASYTQLTPEDPRGWLRRGTAELRAGQFDAAEQSFRQGLQLQNALYQAYNGLGLVWSQRQRYPEAYHAFGNALEINPDYGPALLNRAILADRYFQNKEVGLELYRRYLKLRPLPANTGRVAQAVQRLDAELNPPEPEPEPEVAVAPVAVSATPSETVRAESPPAKPEESTEKPAETASVASSKPPTTTQPPPEPEQKKEQEATAEPVVAESESVETIAEPEKPLTKPASPSKQTPVVPTVASKPAPSREAPKQPTPTPQKPVAQPEKKKRVGYASAPDVARRATTGRSDFPRYRYLAEPPASGGDWIEAQRLIAEGFRAQQRNRLKEAVQDYLAAIEANPSSFDAHYNLGIALNATKQGNEALKAYEMALAIEPESLKARYNFALTLQDSGYYLDAVDEFDILAQSYPLDARIHLNLGNLCAQQLKDANRARQHYLKVLEINPVHPQATPIRYWLQANPAGR